MTIGSGSGAIVVIVRSATIAVQRLWLGAKKNLSTLSYRAATGSVATSGNIGDEIILRPGCSGDSCQVLRCLHTIFYGMTITMQRFVVNVTLSAMFVQAFKVGQCHAIIRIALGV